MAIYLHTPIEPFIKTKENVALYIDVLDKARQCYLAYAERTSLFGLFSVYKIRAFKRSLKEFHAARDAYYIHIEGSPW
jgi:hypothetical protein